MCRRSCIRRPRSRLGSPSSRWRSSDARPAELPLVHRDRPREPGLERGDGLEQVLAVERVPHLEAQHVAGRQTAGCAAERLHRLEQRAPQVVGDVLEREQLEPDLARVARPRHDHGPAPVLGLDALHEREVARLGEQPLHHVHRLGTLDREEAPVLVVHQVHAVVGRRLLQDLQHPLRVRRVRHDEVPLVVEAVDDQVLDHAAALVQHEVVQGLTDGGSGHVVRDDPLQHAERARARAPRPCRGG